MLKKMSEEYFFLNLGGKAGVSWAGYEPGKKLKIIKKKVQKRSIMYVAGPCHTRIYFDTITVHKLLRLEADGVFYNCHYVNQQEDGILHVLMCRAGGMFHPEDILL